MVSTRFSVFCFLDAEFIRWLVWHCQSMWIWDKINRYRQNSNDWLFSMKILSISDKVVSFIYTPQVKERFGDVDLVLACGDLPYAYQEYVISWCQLILPIIYLLYKHQRHPGQRKQILRTSSAVFFQESFLVLLDLSGSLIQI